MFINFFNIFNKFFMEHIKSSFYFQSKEEFWRVDYIYKGHYLKATIYLNDDIYWDFDSIPYTNTQNPTKTQAKEVISAARKAYKAHNLIRDIRDKKIDKIVNS